jgi:hypothetical protein
MAEQSVVLLGDSIFDNQVYVEPGGQCVADHLRARLGTGWGVDLRAVDGAVVTDVRSQLYGHPLPENAHLVLSAGGNDALGHIDLLEGEAASRPFVQVLREVYSIRQSFRTAYDKLLELVTGFGRPVTVCTVYNPAYDDPEAQRLAETALAFFNDVIMEEAHRRDLSVIDLRRVCAERACFANPIEPGDLGGQRIAEAIARRVGA